MDEYDIDPNFPENHPDGILCLRINNDSAGNRLVDTYVIYCVMTDPRDFQDYKAWLLPDGSGIKIRKPKLPSFFLQDIPLFYEKESAISSTTRMSEVHAMVANNIVTGGPSRQTRQITLYFPHGITCNNQYFNDNERKGDPISLETHPLMVSNVEEGTSENDNYRNAAADPSRPERKDVPNQFYGVYWKMVLDDPDLGLEDHLDGAGSQKKTKSRR